MGNLRHDHVLITVLARDRDVGSPPSNLNCVFIFNTYAFKKEINMP